MAKIAKVHVDADAGTVRWEFLDGKGDVEINVNELPEGMLYAAACHGLKQKGSDAYANASKEGWSIRDCADIVTEVMDAIRNDEWNRKATGTGGVIVDALVELSGKSREDAKAWWDDKTEEEQKALAKNANIKAKVAEIKARRAIEAAKDVEFELDI